MATNLGLNGVRSRLNDRKTHRSLAKGGSKHSKPILFAEVLGETGFQALGMERSEGRKRTWAGWGQKWPRRRPKRPPIIRLPDAVRFQDLVAPAGCGSGSGKWHSILLTPLARNGVRRKMCCIQKIVRRGSRGHGEKKIATGNMHLKESF